MRNKKVKIAIVGAGVAGASTALYFICQEREYPSSLAHRNMAS
jgi:thioredoxin reductase